MSEQRSRHLISSAVAGLLAAAPLVASADEVPAPPSGNETCYGVAEAGKNDCATAKHACAGSAQVSKAPEDFKFVPKGSCETLGGKLKPGPTK
jgi:uncharacterized membrane protein